MQKKRVIFLTVIFVLISTVSLLASTYTKEFNKTIDFLSGGKVNVKNVNGKIYLTSWDKESVKVEAEIKVKARSRREADDIFEKVKIIIDRQSDVVTIEPDYPKKQREGGFWDWIFGLHKSTPTVNFTIKVPKKSDLSIRSTNGHLTVVDIKGEVNLGTVNGGIDADEINGPLDAHTTNGAIKVAELNGSLDTHTTNGSITARLTRFSEDDEIQVNTTNGSVRLTLPADIKADVKASTVNGSIHTDFPLTVQGKILKKRLRGKINGGGGIIDLSTVNGSIKIYED